MFRSLACAVLVPALLVSNLSAQQSPRKGKLKKVDRDKATVTIAVDGKEVEFAVTDDTRLPAAPGNNLPQRLKGLQEGNTARPTAHAAAGVALAGRVRPLDQDGQPSTDGKIVLLSVGMSNTAQASEGFQRLLRADMDKNPSLLFVNGAQGGMTAKAIQDPDDNGPGTRYWTTVDDRLKSAGVNRAQVQAVWIKQADAGPSEGFPKYAQTLQAELARIVQIFPERFPNVKLVYLSSRTFGGYAKTRLNPEPYAYESGFSVKWLIEGQTKGAKGLNFATSKGPFKAPWLSWGPYLWANGTTKRLDGFSWNEKDFAGDGTHQSASGQDKVGKLMLEFFKTDATTKPWFVRR